MEYRKNLTLGIETSCDETSIAVISEEFEIIYEKTYSQIDIHRLYGGVVPEIASRDHVDKMQFLTKDLINTIDIQQISHIAVTVGPGLIGSLLSGIMTAKGLAISLQVPIIPVNHLEGHLISPFIKKAIVFPFIMLLVSGGHSQIIIAHEFEKYELLGTTIDDATGECFDKIARMLDLTYPGGPEIEKLAQRSWNHKAFSFKPCLINKDTLNFSFSGLKTQVLYKIAEIKQLSFNKKLTIEQKADIAFAAQDAIAKTLTTKLKMAIIQYNNKNEIPLSQVIICGGVSANYFIKDKVQKICTDFDLNLNTPELKYATDNAAMIARLGLEKAKKYNYKFDINEISEISPKASYSIIDGLLL